MTISWIYIALLSFFIATSPLSRVLASYDEADPMLVETQVLPPTFSPGQGGNLTIKMKLPPGYHAYDDQFKVQILEPEGFKVAPHKVEPLVKWFDKFSKKDRLGIKNEATLTAYIEAPERFLKTYNRMKLELTYQACTDQFCLFPTKKTLEVPLSVTQVEGKAEIREGVASPAETANTGFFDTDNFKKYLGSSVLTGLLFVFLAGIFTSFTPCIFPMIPITLAVLGNHSNERSRWQNFVTSCVYVLGIATTYSLLGLLAASTGGLFGASLGNPYVLTVVCAIFLIMALSMYGLFELQVPAFLRNKLGSGRSEQSLKGAYFTGLFAGIVASPCVGPVLVAILTYVASTQNKLLGFLFLFTYALGLGLIFIVLGLFNQLAKFLPRSGSWMNAFKFVLGSLMLSAFYYYLDLLFPERWFDLALGLGLITVASVYGAFITSSGSALHHIRKGLMLAMLVVGIGYVVLAAFELRPYIRQRISGTASINQIQKLEWQPYSETLLAESAKNKKPVIIDFWADWCAACHELEEHTFTDIRVRALAGNFTLLKFDATKNSEELSQLKKRYNIQGLPTIIFINSHGLWIDALTLTQFEKADNFIKRMEKALQ